MSCRGALIFMLAFVALAAPARAAVHLEPIGTFDSPVYVTSEPDDPDRLLVVEKDGRIMASRDGVVTSYLDIHTLVSNAGERGLLSVALSPDYSTTGQLYVYYSRTDGNEQIDEYTAQGGSVDPATRRAVLTIPRDPCCTNHNGGQMQFGPDGFLYISVGDGGTGGANATNLGNLQGKLLRIWPHPAPGVQFTIPDGNPFKGDNPGSDEIWSYGLRNPWRFSFDRASGDLVIGDVGETRQEEVDYETAPDAGRGVDFGWNRCEGSVLLGTTVPCNLGTLPVYTYPHSGGACAITGGYVVRDESLGELYGRYLFADVCTGRVSSLVLGQPSATGARQEPFTVDGPSSFGEDSCGRLYLAALGSGTVYRFAGDTPAVCTPPGGGDGGGDTPPPVLCGGQKVTLSAPAAGGRLEGTSGRDVIAGSAVDDKIFGHGGGDIVCAGAGNDTVKGNGGADDLRGGDGDDRLRGNGGDDRCKGGTGADDLASC